MAQFIAIIMQHITNFLDTRELLTLSQTCAHMREFVAPLWEVAIRARFSHKKFAPRRAMPDARFAYKFLLNLESRVASAPPHGNAHMFFASARGPEQCSIQCETTHRWVSRYIAHPDLMIRGDIIVDGDTNTYIFDGARGRFAARAISKFEVTMMNLSPVFSIPFEFHITYYDFMSITVGFRVSRKIEIIDDDTEYCTFKHGSDTYSMDAYEGDYLREDIDRWVEFTRNAEYDNAERYMIENMPEMTND